VLIVLLIVIGLLAVLCGYLRRKAVRWLFTLLMVLLWVAFFLLFGYIIGYQAGIHGFSLLKALHVHH